MGEVDPPRAGIVVPFRDVPWGGGRGGPWGLVEGMNAAELPRNVSLDDPLSGILDKRFIRSSPAITGVEVFPATREMRQ